ncbi:MAG: hypothetical protein MJZ58_02065 [Paludibacteraceae bacterium]|nr:hypothetical protein [Paludibacteraceae bacterium]
MKRSIYILLLSLLTTLTWAAEPMAVDTFDCGERVQIKAEPMPGYRFVQWSDGETDSVRFVDIDGDQDIELTAIFEPKCRELQAPVDRIYDWLLVVNRQELVSQGWLTTEASDDSVKWYKIVEPIDPIGAHSVSDSTCDQMVMRGFSLVLKDGESWQDYYAEVNVNAAKALSEYMCTTILRGFPLVRSDLEEITIDGTSHNSRKYEKDGLIYIKRDNQLYTIYGVPINNNQ